uniref:Ubiquitin-like protease family profile domain-containing protein n=1 Tax=Lactuca sativa TaxID=4236 RepID=A0A9R1XV21_LACSA|nr:hypothetical protein LSAT_V11C200095370 [Lactuca sativa]
MEDYVNNPANMFSNLFLCFFLQHDFSFINMKAIVNLKGSGGNIWEVFEVLDDVRRAIFRDTVFGYFIDVPRLQGDTLLFHKMFLHQIRPDPVLSPDGIKRLYFRVGNTKMVYGPEEFCLITGFNFGEYPKNIGKKGSEKLLTSKKRCLLRERLFLDHTNSSVKIGDLKRLILNRKFLELDDVDAVRIWIYKMIPAVRACGLVLRKNKDMPRMKRWSGTKKLKWVDVNKIFFKATEYVYGEGKAVPSSVRDHFRRQDESSSSMSSSGRSYGRGRGSGKHNLDEVLKRLHALEQHVFMNRQPTEVFVKEVVQDEVMNKNNTIENVFGDIQDDKVLEERNDYAGNKFDDDVFDVNDYSEVKEESEEMNDNAGNKFDDDMFDLNDYNEAKEVSDEDEIIITGIVDYFDEYDGKEVTPDKPSTRKPSQYLCPPYTELHTTPKQKRRAKKKVDIKLTSPVPPPVFGVAHDFSMAPATLRSRRDFWSSLFGHTHDGGLESSHITIWYRLLMERRFEGDRHTIMPPNFLVSHALEEGQDWRAFMAGIATYPNFMVAWWDVDTILLPIHSSHNHWLFGELRLASMEVHIYDSLGRGAFEKFKSEGIFSKFERRVANYLDKIKYWARRNIPRIPLNMQFIYEENVPQQSSHLGDCGVFVCMFMEQFVSGQPIRVLIDPKNAALEFRQRMAKIYWRSSLGPM